MDLTSVTNLLSQVLTPELADSTFQNAEVRKLPPRGLERAPNGGGVTLRQGVVSAANASGGVANANNGPFPAAGQNTYLQASNAPQLYDAAMQITDEVEASIAHGGSAVAVVAVEMEKTLGRVWQNFSTDILSSTAPFGIELAVDSAGTYRGISHATAGWGSRETAVGGALTTAVLFADLEALSLPDRCGPEGAQPDVSVVSIEQWINYNQLSGAGTTTSNQRVIVDGDKGMRQNMGPPGLDEPLYFSSQAVVPIRGMTNTVWLMGRRDEIRMHYWDREGSVNGMKIHRPDPVTYGRRIVISWFGDFVIEDPFHWSKDTGVSA